jgi:hypothetical protein
MDRCSGKQFSAAQMPIGERDIQILYFAVLSSSFNSCIVARQESMMSMIMNGMPVR